MPLSDNPASGLPPATAGRWLQDAKADYALCRTFAQRCDACLPSTLRTRRVGWEAYGHQHFALLLPDPSGVDPQLGGDWYLYSVNSESVFRRTRAQCAQMEMLVLAESADDWAALLRRALRDHVFDVRYEVVPSDLDACGEGHLATGFVFTLEAYAPQATRTVPLRIAGAGETPEQAAREACRRWLEAQQPAAEPKAAGRSCVNR